MRAHPTTERNGLSFPANRRRANCSTRGKKSVFGTSSFTALSSCLSLIGDSSRDMLNSGDGGSGVFLESSLLSESVLAGDLEISCSSFEVAGGLGLVRDGTPAKDPECED